MRFSAVVSAMLAVVPALALQITSPSATNFWVAGQPKVISWTTSAGDPELVDITVTNPMNVTLNGRFAIAQNVPVKNLTFTVSNVTLIVGDGYVVNLVTTTNLTNVLASSQSFSLKPNGTIPPNLSSITAPNAAPTPSSTSPSSGNSSANTTASSSGTNSSNSPSASKNASLRAMDGSFVPVLSMLALTAAMTLFGAVITL